jgi:tRNA A37 threonylcarbamoyladenosine dehydratase
MGVNLRINSPVHDEGAPSAWAIYRSVCSAVAMAMRENLRFSAKKSLFAVDGVFSVATLLTPPEAGLP